MGAFSEIDAGLRPPPHIRGSATSLAAAIAIAGNKNPMHKRIMDYLREHPEGATDEQLSQALDMQGSTLRPRRRELEVLGKVRNTGKTAKTLSGRSAILWAISGQ